MKARFGRREPRDIDHETDYLLDNGACIQLVTKDPRKKLYEDWCVRADFRFSKKSFNSLLERNLIFLRREIGFLKYYFFNPSIKETDEVV
jgi:hypothetical protein